MVKCLKSTDNRLKVFRVWTVCLSIVVDSNNSTNKHRRSNRCCMDLILLKSMEEGIKIHYVVVVISNR